MDDPPPRERSRLLAAAGETVRGRVAELAATAVGGLPPDELPPPVRPVARFTPGKRALRGRTTLLAALRGDEFADRVVTWWRENRPDEWDGGGDDPLHVAAVAVLEGRDDAGSLVRDAGERSELARLRVEVETQRTRADRLAAELEAAVAEREAAREAARGAAGEQEAELVKLRTRLREQGVRVRRAEDAAAGAVAALEAGNGDLVAERDGLRRERDRYRELATAAEERARRVTAERDAVRRGAQEARQADDARLALLVDAVAGAAAGLRHELGLAAGGPSGAPRPADLVAAGDGAGRSGGPSGPSATTDVTALDRLLALPGVHLLVDGYNVTKSAWPALALSVQRDRLVAAVAPLAARTGAETTLVFDGAAVVGVPPSSVRGVRVLFSEAGTIADDLIRRLVAAEPAGRPVVVVTSDREVVDSVRRQGAHPVLSRVLVDRLARI